ncbi:MAG: thiamine-monophosphate kinase [Candidatus Lokiarchaeota archaeon]|nr:thiamine-monophosphate kinase [Candidatus Lokiarchaeota archaeon]
MSETKKLDTFGESQLIDIIEEIIFEKTGEKLVRDDSFYFQDLIPSDNIVVLNSDMFVSTTDAPPQMSYYQMGMKVIIANLSDIIVKAVKPGAVIISLGLPDSMVLRDFKNLIEGLVDCSKKYNLHYIGGDINETRELIINPTVLGYGNKNNIIHRTGMSKGDFLVANGKFGLTGVGLDILLIKKQPLSNFVLYKKSIESVLNPTIHEEEAYYLAENSLATASIDSSDGLARSLKELLVSNPGLGFEIYFDHNLFDEEACEYSKEFGVPIENLIFNGGEEFIHLFTIPEEKLERMMHLPKFQELSLHIIGRVTTSNNIVLLKNNKKININIDGYEHFKGPNKID